MINTKKFNLKYTQISALGFAAIIFMGADTINASYIVKKWRSNSVY